MIRFPLFIITVSSLLLFGACKEEDKKTTGTTSREIAFKKEGEAQLFKTDSTKVARLDIEIADNDYETETGLMYRTSMKNNRGMLFIFEKEEPRYFYMKNTQISLDIIYINSEQKVVSIAKNAVPMDETSLPSGGPAKYVLEVNAGLTDKWQLAPGDSISFSRE